MRKVEYVDVFHISFIIASNLQRSHYESPSPGLWSWQSREVDTQLESSVFRSGAGATSPPQIPRVPRVPRVPRLEPLWNCAIGADSDFFDLLSQSYCNTWRCPKISKMVVPQVIHKTNLVVLVLKHGDLGIQHLRNPHIITARLSQDISKKHRHRQPFRTCTSIPPHPSTTSIPTFGLGF